MTINRTTLLDLPLPVTGTESGTWGDVTNNGLAQYVDIAVAGMNALTSSDFTAGALTISNTQGDSGGTNIAAGSAQYATIKVSSLATNSTITAPASNRSYRVVNLDSTYNLTIKASGQTGITFLPGQTGVVAFTGTDYEVVGVVNAASSTDNAVPKFDGTTGQIIQNTGVTIDDSNNVSGVAQLNATTADLTNIEVTNIKAKDGTSAGSIADSTGVVTLASSVLTTTDINGGTIDGAVIGGSSAAAGSFTSLSTSGAVVFNDAGADVDFRVEGDTDANLLFVDASTDRVGIGTSSPTTKLQVDGPADIGGETNNVGIFGSSSTNAGIIGTTANQQLNIFGNGTGPIVFQTGGAFLNGLDVLGTERMRIDSSGNVGIGVTPSAWNSSYRAFQVASHISLWGNSAGGGALVLANNEFFDATNTRKYLVTDFATEYVQVSGQHQWKTAPSGTAGDTITFTQAMTLDASGNVGIGTSSPISASGQTSVTINGTSVARSDYFISGTHTASFTTQAGGTNIATKTSSSLEFSTNDTERARITSGGDLLVGTTSVSFSAKGTVLFANGQSNYVADGATIQFINRLTDDGILVSFSQAGTEEGSISVSGSTVSYNGGHLSRWAQMLTKPDLLKGTVMSNLDEMNVYVKPTLYWTEEGELPVDEEGNPTVAVGDVKQETSVSDNEQLNKVKVSDVEGDPNVAGVFVNWEYDEAHQVDEINMAMTGDMIIRIAEGVTVARGDLLMSAGDGTAKPQGDDIVRSKTIAKVTSTHVTCTYEDGSYCVPCVLMAC
jgi:hypothetical protein